MPKIYLYAEVLTHIRQLTLHASLQSDKDESPEIDISSDKKVITVRHDGESSSLYLPTQILGTANVTFETHKKTELNARIQIEDLEEWKNIEAAGVEAPWIAPELDSSTAIQCRDCGAQVLSSQCVSVWKDLPSQDWADVMDLWYCHKPHDGDDTAEQQDAAESKGTSATSRLASQQGCGMVDLTSFVLHPEDCTNVKISDRDNENNFKARIVSCSTCSTFIGSFSPSENLIRLNKSSLSVKLMREESYKSYDASTFIAAQILSLIETTPIRKIVVHSSHPSQSPPQHTSVPKDPTNHATEPQSLNPTKSAEQASPTPPSDPSTSTSNQEQPQEQSTQPPTSSTPSTSFPNPEPESESQSEPAGLLLWIFNPNIYYSSSLHPSNTPNPTPSTPSSTPAAKIATAHRALKIFYRPLTPSSLTQHLEPQTQSQSTTEELHLPSPSTLTSLHSTLQTSTAMLPTSARKFQDWHVGLLDRFERHATAEDVLGENPLARKVTGDKVGGFKATRWELPAGWEELYL